MTGYSGTGLSGIIASRLHPRQSENRSASVLTSSESQDFQASCRLTCAAYRSISTVTRAVLLLPPVASVRTSERLGGQDAESCPRYSRRVPLDFAVAYLQKRRHCHRLLPVRLCRHGNHAHARARRTNHAPRAANRRLGDLPE